MARRRIQHATSASRPNKKSRVKEPTTPWVDRLPVDTWKKELEAANPGKQLRRVRKGPAIEHRTGQGYHKPKVPKEIPLNEQGYVQGGKDTVWMCLDKERHEARAFHMQERGDRLREAVSQGQKERGVLMEDNVDYGEGE